jgi:hypothetical protein
MTAVRWFIPVNICHLEASILFNVAESLIKLLYTINPMRKIERLPHAAVVLKPTVNFLNWSLPFHDPMAKVQFLDSDVFMIPDLNDVIDIHQWLHEHFTDLFIHFVSEWTDTEAFWPDVDDYEVFCNYFDVEVMPMAWRVNQ